MHFSFHFLDCRHELRCVQLIIFSLSFFFFSFLPFLGRWKAQSFSSKSSQKRARPTDFLGIRNWRSQEEKGDGCAWTRSVEEHFSSCMALKDQTKIAEKWLLGSGKMTKKRRKKFLPTNFTWLEVAREDIQDVQLMCSAFSKSSLVFFHLFPSSFFLSLFFIFIFFLGSISGGWLVISRRQDSKQSSWKAAADDPLGYIMNKRCEIHKTLPFDDKMRKIHPSTLSECLSTSCTMSDKPFCPEV